MTEKTDDKIHWRLLINYARFVSYKGDPVALTNANNRAVFDEKTEYFAMQASYENFRGLNMMPVDRQAEIEAWQLINLSAK